MGPEARKLELLSWRLPSVQKLELDVKEAFVTGINKDEESNTLPTTLNLSASKLEGLRKCGEPGKVQKFECVGWTVLSLEVAINLRVRKHETLRSCD